MTCFIELMQKAHRSRVRETTMKTCGHAYPMFRVTLDERHVLMCWACVKETIQEGEVGQRIVVVRMDN